MASSAAEEESRPLVGVQSATPTSRAAPRRAWSWRITSLFAEPDPDAQQLETLERDMRRYTMPSRSEMKAMDRNLVKQCLDFYNAHCQPGDEYEPAPGVVSRYCSFKDGLCWKHGNFVARRKRSGCFSFLPAPRTLFFYELVVGSDAPTSNGVATCVPLDEPVTEAYRFLCFPLGWGTRRSGKVDCVCRTCDRRFDVPHLGVRKTFACGHDRVKIVCRMCYLRSGVLHPPPGQFAYGTRKNSP